MKAKTKTKKEKVIVKIPAVNKAWLTLCDVTSTSDTTNTKALKVLAAVIKNQEADATSVKKSIEATGKKSSVIGYGSVKALPTWLALNTKYKEMQKMPLKAQITFATKCYSLLGKGEAEKLTTWTDVENSANDAQAEKTRKAKAAKAAPAKEAKKPATLTDSLKAIYALVVALGFDEIADSHIDQWNQITAAFEEKAHVNA